MSSSPSKRFRFSLLILLVALAVLLGLGWYWLSAGRTANTQPSINPWNAPVAVRAVPVAEGDLQVRLRAIGTVVPLARVTVRSRVDGELVRIAFEESQTLEQGQLLAEIDPQPYRIALEQAEGEQQQNLARLRQAETELTRYRLLFDQDSIARQEVESREAEVNQLRGLLKADQARVDNARLQLTWSRIEAPIAGRAGLRRLDQGNLVSSADSEGLVTIVQTQPIAVQFSVPERELAAIRAGLATGQGLSVQAYDRDDRELLAEGLLRTFDNEIDIATGTLRLKAEFANDDEQLFPNQFVNLRLAVRDIADALTIPAAAVQHGSQGDYVYIIRDGRSHVRPVQLGSSDGEQVVIADGLQAGELVALEGLDRLREGREVILVDSAQEGAAPSATGD